MKLYKKLLLAAALVVVVSGCYAAYRVHQVQASYYAMAGEVTVMDKFESGTENYIVIEEATQQQFTLSCSQEDYDRVHVGDQINCERHQSIVTHQGEVHSIQSHAAPRIAI